MTKALSTVVKKYHACLRDGRIIPIDDFDKTTIESAKIKGNFSEFVQIGQGTEKYYGEVGAIVEIKETKLQKLSGGHYVCDFGTRHPLADHCTCKEQYQKMPIAFRMMAYEIYQKYPIQLTDEELRHIHTFVTKY